MSMESDEKLLVNDKPLNEDQLLDIVKSVIAPQSDRRFTTLRLYLDAVVPYEAQCRYSRRTSHNEKFLGLWNRVRCQNEILEGTFTEYVRIREARVPIDPTIARCLLDAMSGDISLCSAVRAIYDWEKELGLVYEHLHRIDREAIWELSAKTNEEFYRPPEEEELEWFYGTYSRDEIENDEDLKKEEAKFLEQGNPANSKYELIRTQILDQTGSPFPQDVTSNFTLEIAGGLSVRDQTYYDYTEERCFTVFSKDDPMVLTPCFSQDDWETCTEFSELQFIEVLKLIDELSTEKRPL